MVANPAARFNGPAGEAVDSAGDVYLADTGNNRITKGTPSGLLRCGLLVVPHRGDVDGEVFKIKLDI